MRGVCDILKMTPYIHDSVDDKDGDLDRVSQKLRSQIQSVESSLRDLKSQLADAEAKQPTRPNTTCTERSVDQDVLQSNVSLRCPTDLTLEEYKRYGRQLIVPQFGMAGQLHRLSSVIFAG